MPYLASQILRKNNALFALAEQMDLKISNFVVADDSARDAIPAYVRMTGAECKVLDSAEAGGGQAFYELESDLTTWTLRVLTDYIPNSEKGQPSGVATLDSEGFINPQQIRNLFINSTYIVADTTAMLALTTVTGNVVMIDAGIDAGNVYLKLNDNDPSLITDFADLTSAVSVSSVKVGENGVAGTGAIAFTLSTLLSATTDFTSFNSQVASAPSVAGNTSAISTIQSQITTINQDIVDILALISGVGQGITVHVQASTYDDDVYVWANGRVYHSKSAVPADTVITDTTYWDVFGGYPEDVLTDGDVEATLTGTVGKIPDSNATKTYVDNLLPGVGVPGGALNSIQFNKDDQLFDGFGEWDGQRLQIPFEDGVVDVKELFSLKRTTSLESAWSEIGTDALLVGTIYHNSVVFDDGGGDRIWVVGGQTNSGRTRKVYKSSADGTTFSEVGTDILPVATREMAVVVFDDGGGNRIWVIGGDTAGGGVRKVYKSALDGTSFSEVGTDILPAAIAFHDAVVFDDGGGNRIWTTGGQTSGSRIRKVYKSALDGTSFSEVGTNILPIGTQQHTSVVFDDGGGNRIWVIGGNTSTGSTRKVYKSALDGTSFSEAGTNAIPVSRQDHSSVVLDSKIWIFGGDSGGEESSAVYWSSDGENWNLFDISLITATHRHSSLVFNNIPWVIGGGTPTEAFTRKVFSLSTEDLTGMGVNDSVYLEDNVGILKEALKRIIKWSSSTNSEYAVQVLLNGVLTEIISLVGDHLKLNGYAQLQEITDPAGSPATGFGRLWLSSTTSKLRFQDDSGNKFDIDMTPV